MLRSLAGISNLIWRGIGQGQTGPILSGTAPIVPLEASNLKSEIPLQKPAARSSPPPLLQPRLARPVPRTLCPAEALEEFEREPTPEEKRKPSWTWQLKQRRATGQLIVEVSAMGLRGQRGWTENKSKPIEEVLARVMEKIAAAFEGMEAQRQQNAERQRQQIEQEKQRAEREAKEEKERQEKERISKHQNKLQEIARVRRFNLGVAAQQWEDSKRVLAFVDALEKRWRGEPAVELSPAQQEWLTWARAEAKKLAPWSEDYPDPKSAQLCDPKNIPIGGPYPKMTKLKPHEFRIPEPKSEPSPYSQYYGSRC